MLDRSATAYFERLAEAWQALEVTGPDRELVPVEEAARRTVETILSVRSAGGKVMLVANGGSAAIVSHMQNDLCKAVGVRAIVFNEAPLLTALTNDEGYDQAFQRCVDLWAAPGDLLFAISSSGRSENILRAVEAARTHGCSVITLAGFAPDNPLRQMGDLNFYVPSQTYGCVELAHATLTHFLSDCARTLVRTS